MNSRSTIGSFLKTEPIGTTLLIRLMVGAVFLPAEIGAGRFAKIGLPSPEFLGPFVGSFEVTCGGLILFGLLVRLAAIPLLIIMAMASTKIPILMNQGFWKLGHESRTDYSMTLGLLFLLIVSAGRCSVDRMIQNEPGARS